MFQEMRRQDRQLSEPETMDVLTKGIYGVLSMNGVYPYGVPLSYVYKHNCLYFHCALEGSKLDNIYFNSKVCFTVVGSTKILEDKFSTEFESVMAFGDASIIEGEEKLLALREFIEKYSPTFIEEGELYINRTIEKTCVVKIKITQLTGKHRI